MRDIEQLVQAEPDRWPGLKLGKINGHKEPELAASHGLLRQWPSVVFYLRGRAIAYPSKLVAGPMLEAIESVMHRRPEDVPLRRVGSLADWKVVLKGAEEVIVLYDRCQGVGDVRGRKGEAAAVAVHWRNGSEAESGTGGQVSDSGRHLVGVSFHEMASETAALHERREGSSALDSQPINDQDAKASGQERRTFSLTGLPKRDASADRTGFPRSLADPICPAETGNLGSHELTDACPAGSMFPSSFPSAEQDLSAFSDSAKLHTRSLESGPCSAVEQTEADAIRAQVEELAWRALLIPSKLALVQVSSPEVLELALRKQVNGPKAESPSGRAVGDWVQSVLSGLVTGGVNALTLGEEGLRAGDATGGIWQGLSRSVGSLLGRSFDQGSLEAQRELRHHSGARLDASGSESLFEGALPTLEASTGGEGAPMQERVSRLPWLVVVQTHGRGPPKGFCGGSGTNLTAFLERVPGPILEEVKWDSFGGAFQNGGPVVVIFFDRFSRFEAVRNGSQVAMESLRAVAEGLERGLEGEFEGGLERELEEGSAAESGLAEEGSLLEGLWVEGFDALRLESKVGEGESLKAGAGDERIEPQQEDLEEDGARVGESSEDVSVGNRGSCREGESCGSSEGSSEENEGRRPASEDEKGSGRSDKSRDGSSRGTDEKSSKTSSEIACGGRGSGAPLEAKLDKDEELDGQAVQSEGLGRSERKASDGGHLEPQLERAASASSQVELEAEGAASGPRPSGGGANSDHGSDKRGVRTVPGEGPQRPPGLQGADMQALLQQLADRLKGLPTGSKVEIEVHHVSQQGLSEESASSAQMEALPGGESQSGGVAEDGDWSENKTSGMEDGFAETGGGNEGEMEETETAGFKFVYMDGEEALAQQMGIEIDLRYGLGVPALAVIDPPNKAFHVYPPGRPFSREGIEGFLVSFREGKLQPDVKFAPPAWLPPRLPKGSRVAFPVPSVSAADFPTVVFGTSYTEAVKGEGEREARRRHAAASHVTVDGWGKSGVEQSNVAACLSKEGLQEGFIGTQIAAHASHSVGALAGNETDAGLPESGGQIPQPDLPPGRNVLVLFTTSWCGFCQRAEVVLREVARSVELQGKAARGFGVTGTGGVAGGGRHTPNPEGGREESVTTLEGTPVAERGAQRKGGRVGRVLVLRMDCDENDCKRASGLDVSSCVNVDSLF
jgi:thiol-disulfide isomerase/thioredoxin